MKSDKSLSYANHCEELARAFQFERIECAIRKQNDHFKVTEHLSFELTGEGEHLFLLIEKDGCNTEWLARQLQNYFQVSSAAIGYAGKKDRHSVSQQWFSVQLPGLTDDEQLVAALTHPEYRLLKHQRHNRKLRKGAISHNSFELILSDVSQPIKNSILETISHEGVPNYFGYQRFGHNASNITQAEEMLTGQWKVKSREKRSTLLSSARSFLFNLMLSARVSRGTWNAFLAGDCVSLDGSNSFFKPEDDDSITERLVAGDIHISGWLSGRQQSACSERALEIEKEVLTPYLPWLEGISKQKVDSARRAFRVLPKHLVVSENGDQIKLSFSLPSGCFATSVLREIADFKDLAIEQTTEVRAQGAIDD